MRSALFDDGKIVQVIMKPHLGPLAQKRFLFPKTRVVLKLIPNSDDFVLTYANDATTKTYGVYIKASKLRIKTVKLTPQVATQVYRNLQKTRAIYPTPTPTMTTSLIESGLSNSDLNKMLQNGTILSCQKIIVKGGESVQICLLGDPAYQLLKEYAGGGSSQKFFSHHLPQPE